MDGNEERISEFFKKMTQIFFNSTYVSMISLMMPRYYLYIFYVYDFIVYKH